MSLLRRAWARGLAWFRRDRLEQEFDEEVRAHIALATDDYLQRGVPLEEAERRACLAFGSVAASKEAHRESRGVAWLDALVFDTRLALRSLRRDPGFSLTVIVTLAVAIALNVTVTTVREAMVVRGMPLARDSQRLAHLAMCDSRPTCRAVRVPSRARL
ncbi:MAG: permease prefix domain 1-containing protein [Vicinamibacterales bacterium]